MSKSAESILDVIRHGNGDDNQSLRTGTRRPRGDAQVPAWLGLKHGRRPRDAGRRDGPQHRARRATGKGDKLIQFVQARIGVTGVAGVPISRRSGRFLPAREMPRCGHAGARDRARMERGADALDSDGKLSQKYTSQKSMTGPGATNRSAHHVRDSVERTILHRKGNRP